MSHPPPKPAFRSSLREPRSSGQTPPALNRSFSMQVGRALQPFGYDEYNILVLGETGTGKSTSINALANYIRFTSFEEALAVNEFVNLIPAKFSLTHPEKIGETWVIEDGHSENEDHSVDGAAKTQGPWSYVFRFGDKVMRIIDTPGMGDPRGVDMDKMNFDRIIYDLRFYQHLHGIIVLIKANENRATASFKYCISQLLTHLHRDACRNLIFCFTHSRNTFYEPGDGLALLRAFLKQENLEDAIELKIGENCFFIDNEAYRFLVARKHGYPFSETKIRVYKESWDQSVSQAERMLTRVIQNVPHPLEYSTLLHSARKLMESLAQPMVDIQRLIGENVQLLRQKLTQINAQEREQVALFDAEQVPLDEPTLVCTSERCMVRLNTNGEVKEIYHKRCHRYCKIEGVETNLVGDPKIQRCHVFKTADHSCSKCGCDWKVHMHLKYKFVKVQRILIHDLNQDPEFQLRQAIQEYQDEYRTIQEISSKFALMLRQNSNSPINRYIEPYLDILIAEEDRKLREIVDHPVEGRNLLMKMKSAHQEALRQILNAEGGDSNDNDTVAFRNPSPQPIRIQDVNTYRDQLLGLKWTGNQFRTILQDIAKGQKQFTHGETPVDVF